MLISRVFVPCVCLLELMIFVGDYVLSTEILSDGQSMIGADGCRR
jgi:hypothetical protein